MRAFICALIIIGALFSVAEAQTPTPTPTAEIPECCALVCTISTQEICDACVENGCQEPTMTPTPTATPTPAQGDSVRHRRVADRRMPIERPDFPRTVGVNLQYVSLQCGPTPWWHITCQREGAVAVVDVAEDVALKYDLSALALGLEPHPWDNTQNWENVRPFFRSPLLDVILFIPQFYGVQGTGCGDEYRQTIKKGLTIGGWPTGDSDFEARLCGSLQEPRRSECLDRHQSMYDGLYQYYSGQDKDIIVTQSEAGWDIFGNGCRAVDECDMWPGYWALQACRQGKHVVWDERVPEDGDCYTKACYQLRYERVEWMIRLFDERQKAAQDARARYRDSTVRVWNNVELIFFGTRDWQFITVARDVIPRMKHQPDSVSISLYNMSEGPEWAINYVMEHTGLPIERIFISEIGHRDRNKQYDRIYNWVDTAFEMGVRMAFVWDIEYTADTYYTGFSVVDPDTGEPFAGMQAIQDLNAKWRVR